jgi:glycosyltransferase involved in cell wall biosynthesis
MLISACLIVKNEESKLDKCLNSLKDYCDEIIIVDTGSKDNTIHIAQKYTNQIFTFDWCDDFSAARNFSISKAKSEFILIIDADEILLNGLEMRSFIESQPKDYGGWLVNLDSTNTQIKGYVSKFSSQLLRIFRNHKNFKFSGIIHEQVLPSILEQNFRIGNSNIKIFHSGYDLTEKEMKKKQERNLKLLINQTNKDPNDGYNLFNIAKTYFALNDFENAEKYFEKALDNTNKTGVIYPATLNYYASLLYQIKKFDKVIELCNESLKINNNQAFANYILGDTYHELHHYDKSLNHYLILEHATINPSNFSKIIGDYHLPYSQVCFRIGRNYIFLNKFDDAKVYFQIGLSENSKDRNCLIGLAEYYYKIKDITKAKEIINNGLLIHINDKDLLKMKEQIENQSQNSYINQIKVNLHSSLKSNKVSSVEALKSRIKVKQTESNQKILRQNDFKQRNEKPLITLSMIVKNEEKMLAGCLDSVIDLVDEIVIVDTGSTDKTKDIAKLYNAKLYDFKWVDDFAVARNEALKYSTGKWILYLDADERIDIKNLDVNKLRNDLKNAPDNLGGIVLTIESDHSNMDGSTEKHRGGYPRLFKNLGYPKVYFKGRVHEQITPSLMEHNLGMISSDIKIIHEGYNIPEEEMQKKLKRNYTLLLKHVQEEPLNGYAWYQLGQTLGRLQLMKESEDAIKMAISCDDLSNSVYASACSTLSQYAGNKRNYQEALNWAEESLKKAPNQIYGLNLKGFALLELNRKKEAKEIFKMAHQLWKSQQNSVPQSGFDIMIKEEIILNGLKRSEKID